MDGDAAEHIREAVPVIASYGDGKQFRNGRQFAASIGLVPRQHTTGDRPVLLGISKRGDKYLRTLLIHGARSVVRAAAHKDDALSQWINRLVARRGFHSNQGGFNDAELI